MNKRALEDLTGRKFGKLTVLRFFDIANAKRRWLCRCECGKETKVATGALKRGATTSCGCKRMEHMLVACIKSNTTHGKTHTKEYLAWRNMKSRCSNPNYKNYKSYGALGVAVCERWQIFENFYADMGDCPEGYSLDRIDPHGNYEPDNCRWADHFTQCNNQRRTKRITFDGETKSLGEWAKTIGIKRQTLYDRIYRRGWALERAMTKGA